MKVLVKKYVEQDINGKKYKGWIKIGGIQFDYKIEFGVLIPRLEKIEPAKSEAEVRRIFQMTISRDSKEIELSDQEYAFFLMMIVDFVIEFYNNPQTQGNNGLFGFQAVYEEAFPKLEIPPPSIGMRCEEEYSLSQVCCKMLRQPKFGCTLSCE